MSKGIYQIGFSSLEDMAACFILVTRRSGSLLIVGFFHGYVQKNHYAPRLCIDGIDFLRNKWRYEMRDYGREKGSRRLAIGNLLHTQFVELPGGLATPKPVGDIHSS